MVRENGGKGGKKRRINKKSQKKKQECKKRNKSKKYSFSKIVIINERVCVVTAFLDSSFS